MSEIRQATLADVDVLLAIKQATWPQEATPNTTTMRTALQTADHRTYLAQIAGHPAGFVSCFVTRAATGEFRWEVDLLAVHPSFRRQGLGSLLVKTAVSATPTTTSLSRALIATDNIASQRSFARHGFHSNALPHTLYISDNAPDSEGVYPTNDCHFVQVNTLNYRGIWVEGKLSPQALAAAQVERINQQLDVVGVLIPSHNATQSKTAQQQQFVAVGQYQWWEKRPF